jgi:hypothetical protein
MIIIMNLKGSRAANNIVMDLSNMLPGNGTINTVQHATIEQRDYANHFLAAAW